MSDNKVYVCQFCQQTWAAIPEDAIRLTNRNGPSYSVYKFANGEIHSIAARKAQPAKEQSS